MSLCNGAVTVIDSVKSFKLPEEAAGWFAYLNEEPKKKEDKSKTGKVKRRLTCSITMGKNMAYEYE